MDESDPTKLRADPRHVLLRNGSYMWTGEPDAGQDDGSYTPRRDGPVSINEDGYERFSFGHWNFLHIEPNGEVLVNGWSNVFKQTSGAISIALDDSPLMSIAATNMAITAADALLLAAAKRRRDT